MSGMRPSVGGLGRVTVAVTPSSVLPCVGAELSNRARPATPVGGVYRAAVPHLLAALDFLDPEKIIDWLGPVRPRSGCSSSSSPSRACSSGSSCPATRCCSPPGLLAAPGQVRTPPRPSCSSAASSPRSSATRSATCSASASGPRCSGARLAALQDRSTCSARRTSSRRTGRRRSCSRASCRSCARSRRSSPASARCRYRTFFRFNVIGGVHLGGRRAHRRLLARLDDPEHRQVPAADHLRHRVALAHPAVPRVAPAPQGRRPATDAEAEAEAESCKTCSTAKTEHRTGRRRIGRPVVDASST